MSTKCDQEYEQIIKKYEEAFENSLKGDQVVTEFRIPINEGFSEEAVSRAVLTIMKDGFKARATTVSKTYHDTWSGWDVPETYLAIEVVLEDSPE